MAVYLIDRPPRIRQYRSPRRATPSGVCVVHTAESFPDEVGPDGGAENVAAFIRDRRNHGSYHDLADSDSIVHLVRYSDEAFHDGTGSNPHSYGVSAATQAHRWPSLSDGWVDATVRNMARAAARYARWVKREHGVTVPARRISRAQSQRRVPGFISHAERDPARRTDPGKTFPWGDFLRYYAAEMNGDDDMTPEQAQMLKDLHEVVANGNRAQIANPRTGDDVSVRYGVQEAWQTAEQLFDVLCNGNTAEMRRPGGGTASVRYGVERSWAGVEALKAMVAELATGPAANPGEFLDRVQARVEQGIAAGVEAEIPAVVTAVLDALGDRAGLTQDDVVDAVKQALREGAGT